MYCDRSDTSDRIRQFVELRTLFLTVQLVGRFLPTVHVRYGLLLFCRMLWHMLSVLAARSKRYSRQERSDPCRCASAGVDHLGWSSCSGLHCSDCYHRVEVKVLDFHVAVYL